MSALMKRKQNPLFVLAILGFIVVAVGAWWVLVHQVQISVDTTLARAAALEAEVTKGKSFLTVRPDDKTTSATIIRTADDLERRIPVGRHDLQFAQHFEKAANAAGILEFSYEVVGGMALAEDSEPVKKTANDLLALNPDKLKSVDVTLSFKASYSQMVSLVRAAYQSPWHVEINQIEMSRGENPSQTMKGRMSTRYYYQ